MSIESDNWRYRAIRHCRGNQTPVGTLLLAVINRNAKNPPWFGATAEITRDGKVISSFTDRHRKLYFPYFIGTVADFTATFSKLADELKFTDEERIELFRLVRQWCARDLRDNIKLNFTSGG
jgi:hypothetical protein